jgi:hypothetical protein
MGSRPWVGLAQLGSLRAQIVALQAQLAECVKTHTAALTGTVVVMDASGAAGPLPAQNVTLWDLAASASKEVAGVQAGSFGFTGPVPAQPALTVQSSGDPNLTGLDFRSGALAAPVPEQPRLEIVIGPPITIGADEVNAALDKFQTLQLTTPANSGLNISGAPASLTFGSLTVKLSAGLITISGGGTVSGGPLPVQAAFTGTIMLALVPSGAPGADKLVEVVLAGQQPITATVAIGGINLSAALVPLITQAIGQPVADSMSTWANENVTRAVLESFALTALPGGVGITLRHAAIDENGIALQAALGTIGTALSTIQPDILPAPQV